MQSDVNSVTALDPLARQNQIPRGIAYMVASTVVFAGVNAIVKWEVAKYPVGEVAFYRALFALVAVSVIILPRAGIGVFRTRRYLAHLQRGVSQFGSMTCMFFAFSLMSLGSAVAISFAAPLFTTLLSATVLKERVGIHRWSALVVGFIGVVIVTEPGRRHVSGRRALRARQCGADLLGRGGDPANEPHRVRPKR